MIWSTKVGTTPTIMTVSAPARRELVRVVTEMLAASISLASSAWSTVGLALIAMISGVDALFLQELSIFHDPDGTIGRTEAGPGQAQSFLSRDLLA